MDAWLQMICAFDEKVKSKVSWKSCSPAFDWDSYSVERCAFTQDDKESEDIQVDGLGMRDSDDIR
jgi:hypothetical protein